MLFSCAHEIILIVSCTEIYSFCSFKSYSKYFRESKSQLEHKSIYCL